MLAEILAKGFETNTYVIGRETEGLTHADSLIQPAFNSNCLNWVLGHIMVSRTLVQRHLGLPPIWHDDQIARYATGSEPVTADADGVKPLDDLLADLRSAAEQIAAALRAMSEADLAAVPEGEERSLGQLIHGLLWHETYHTGQTDLLRQIAGTNDKVF